MSRADLKLWRRFLEGTFSLFQALDDQLRSESGLSHHDFGILSALANERSSRLRMSELAVALGSSPSRLSHSVDRLEAKGWVERVKAVDDGRGTFARVTPEGAAKLEQAWPGHAKLVRELVLDQMDGSERQEFEEIFARIGRATAGRG